MSNLQSVSVVNGIPVGGTGSVSTIDALMADGGQATIGAKADTRSTATDTTPATLVAILKQISYSLQALAASAIDPFQIGGSSLVLQPTTSSVSGQLPVAAADVLVTNATTSVAYIKFSNTSSPTAAGPAGTPVLCDTPVPAGSAQVFHCGTAQYVAAVLAAGSGNVIFTPGRGL